MVFSNLPCRGPLVALAVLLLALCGLAASPARAAGPPEIWLGLRASTGNDPAKADYQTTFHADNPAWPSVASKIQVLLVSSDNMFNATDAEIVNMVNDLHSRHVALAIAIMTIARRDDQPCSIGEGYETTLRHQRFAERLARLHARPDIIRVDGPFYAGHYIKCQLSIPDLVARASPTISAWAKVFPGIVFGDVEPWTFIGDHPGWQAEYAAMKQGIEAATGQKLVFAHSDINENRHPNWAQELTLVPPFVHRLGMKWGMTYNGRGQDQSNEQWIANAKAKVVAMEDRLRVVPDQAVFQSWDRFPAHALPPSDPNTLSGLMAWYVARRH